MPEGYRLYPGDLVRIEVFDHPDLTVSIRIPVDGVITFPLVGKIDGVVGLTEDAFTKRIQKGLLDGYLKQAVLSMTVIEYGPRRVYVMGSVKRAESIELSPFAPLTAIQAIGQCGGFTDDANRQAGQVIRVADSRDGRRVSLPLPNFDDPKALAKDIALQPGDLIVVPPLDRVYIIGEVSSPGPVNLPSGSELTVSKAISLAGGFARFARKEDVQLLRAGQPMAVVNVQRILAGAADVRDPVLQPGDTVFIPESRF